MAKKVSKLVILLIILAGVAVAAFFLGRTDMVKDQLKLIEKISRPASLNPVKNLPESNPFKQVELNPFTEGYKNPFAD